MQQQEKLRYLLGTSLLLAFTLGCGVVSWVNEVKSTADVVRVTVESGLGFLGTGEAIVTEVGESGLVDTAAAVVTKVDESGIIETAQAAATGIYISPDDVPEEIPVVEGEKNAFVGSPNAISYFIELEYSSVLEFYQREMPARGWSEVEFGTTVTDLAAELHYEMGDRTATVVITQVPIVNQTAVVITIEED